MTENTRLRVVPITLREANTYVAKLHRHHPPVTGMRFAIGADLNGSLVGVAIVGRTVARMLDDGTTAEVTRVCTDGTPNACSFLYGAAWRAARAIGYQRLVTYILATEIGASLRAAGWRLVGPAGGGSWSRADRPRTDDHPLGVKLRWEVAVPGISDRTRLTSAERGQE